MDRNTITGLVIIAAIMIGFGYLNRPSEEEIAKQKRYRDSIELVQQAKAEETAKAEKARLAESKKQTNNGVTASSNVFNQDSIKKDSYVIENQLIKVSISNIGGAIESVELKNYTHHDSIPLMLWNNDKKLGLNFYAQNNTINTADFVFKSSTEAKHLDATSKAQSLSMKLFYSEEQYIEYNYTVHPDNYMIDFNINVVGLDNIIPRRTTSLDLYWDGSLAQFEKSKMFEDRYTGLYYKYYKDDVDYLSATSDEEETLETKVKWVAFKQQFFSSVLIADNSFTGVKVSTKKSETENVLKEVGSNFALPYQGKQIETYNMRFYFGPNHFLTLKEYGDKDDLELTELINLGWKWVAWFNRYVVIYIFNWLEKAISNYGIIILILTLLIKLCLFPLTYKSYMSSAKMRVLKPQIDEISKKYPGKDKAMEKQRATMALYKKAGVNPMGGCLPMVLQMPILIALFYFFPASIELRGKSFLWATDLSSYDSIATLPFNIPFYGDHVSLFCLLMTITNIIYMRMNNKNQVQNEQMKGMQTMMYIMPIMFLFWFNNYAAGLSYYYFIATLITVLQTIIIRRFVDDKKLLAKIELSKKKPVKKSKFQQRIEDMQKQAANQRK